MVRSELALSPEGGVTMQLSVRSGDKDVSKLIISSVGSQRKAGLEGIHFPELEEV